MWPFPLGDLFMAGQATLPKLQELNINTIGELANYDFVVCGYILKNSSALSIVLVNMPEKK